MNKNLKNKQTHQDSAWKDLLEKLFPKFLEFFFNEIYQEIDFSRKYTFLDKEFEKIIKDNKTGKRFADKLVKVYLKDGSERWLILHVEIQGKKEEKFTERIFIYNYKIFDRYRKDVISLAVLTDKNKKFRPDIYEVKRGGFTLFFQFPLVKIIDYKDKIEELEKSNNPFAMVVITYLKLIKLRKKVNENLYELKISMAKEIIKSRKYRKREIFNLLKFIDWMITLPEDMEVKFNEEIIKIEGGVKMAYVASFERFAMEKGKQKGRQEGRQEGMFLGKQESVIKLLKKKFNEIPLSLEEKIRNINSLEKLEEILLSVLDINSVEEFEKII